MSGSIALLIKGRNFPARHIALQTGRTIPASTENWSANDIASTPSMANWPLQIIGISSMLARTELAERNDLKLSIGRTCRFVQGSGALVYLISHLRFANSTEPGLHHIFYSNTNAIGSVARRLNWWRLMWPSSLHSTSRSVPS